MNFKNYYTSKEPREKQKGIINYNKVSTPIRKDNSRKNLARKVKVGLLALKIGFSIFSLEETTANQTTWSELFQRIQTYCNREKPEYFFVIQMNHPNDTKPNPEKLIKNTINSRLQYILEN